MHTEQFPDIPASKEIETVRKLTLFEIISITLDQHDNAQLIFERLNSTGLALTEGDKIRNYILMGRYEVRKRYWTYALPIIQKQHAHRGTFSNCSPTTSNSTYGYFGISGFHIDCTANYDDTAVYFYKGKSDTSQNKSAFELLMSYREEIEE